MRTSPARDEAPSTLILPVIQAFAVDPLAAHFVSHPPIITGRMRASARLPLEMMFVPVPVDAFTKAISMDAEDWPGVRMSITIDRTIADTVNGFSILKANSLEPPADSGTAMVIPGR